MPTTMHLLMRPISEPCPTWIEAFAKSLCGTPGTLDSDIWEVDESPEVLLWGHDADLYQVAVNQRYPHIFATASDSDRVVIWDALNKKVTSISHLACKTSYACPLVQVNYCFGDVESFLCNLR